MFGKKKINKEEVDKQKLNELINLSRNSLKILYILLIVVGIYAVVRLTKEVKILES